jgi:hypothetical protein
MEQQRVNINDLLAIIGNKEVELVMLRSRIAELEKQIEDAKQEKK